MKTVTLKQLKIGDVVIITLPSGYICHGRVNAVGVDHIYAQRIYDTPLQAMAKREHKIPADRVGALLRRNGVAVC